MALGVCTDDASCRALLCSEQHCTDSQNYSHAVCFCQKPYLNGCLNNPSPNCCSYTAESPIYVASPGCYCCCSCFASDTPVVYGVGESGQMETKAIREFVRGDPVYVADDVDLKHWSTRTVAFSSGTGEGGLNTLLKIEFAAPGGDGALYCNHQQLFLMPDGKLKRASRLVPEQDSLVTPDGTPAKVISITPGRYKKGVHHIATTDGPATTVGGHLIVADGVVSGDYALQITNLDQVKPEVMVEGHADLPEVGTRAYAEAYGHLLVGDFAAVHAGGAEGAAQRRAAVGDDEDEGEDHSVFEPFGARPPVRIPEHAQAFVTDEQARDILKNAPAYPPTSSVGLNTVNYLFKVFTGFYPGVHFYMDMHNPLPNAYSFKEYGETFVVVSAQLARTKAMHYEGLALAIAHELGHLYGGDPVDRFGYSCTGMADWAAVSAIIPYVWMGVLSKPMVQPGIDQVKEFFSYIDPRDREGVPGNTCNRISIECREKALAAGATNIIPLPECAGGPPDPTLAVVGATAGEQEDGTYVVVEFSAPVDPATAELVSAYMFDPSAPATAAAMEVGEPARVRVTVALNKDVEYGAWAFGVLSTDGHPLIAGQNVAHFRLGDPLTIKPPAAAGAQS
jgi:hypothetical protein